MRSVYIASNDSFWENISEYRGEKNHHLVKVVRVKDGEKIIFFDGNGRVILTEVIASSIKSLILKFISTVEYTPHHSVGLGLSVIKKDAFELALRMSVECGICEFFPLYTDFSERDFCWSNRHRTIIENSLEQSNSFRYPVLHPPMQLEDFQESETPIYYLDFGADGERGQGVSQGKELLFVGPEAGWGSTDRKVLQNIGQAITLPMPILRAPTACIVGLSALIIGTKYVRN